MDRVKGDYLWVRPGAQKGRADLCVASDSPGQPKRSSTVLKDAGPAWAFSSVEDEAPDVPGYESLAHDFRHGTSGRTKVHSGFWAANGLTLKHADGSEEVFAMETPFMAWPVRSPTVLPNDDVVFQAGDQVLVMDLKTRDIACIARGSSPVVRLLPPPAK